MNEQIKQEHRLRQNEEQKKKMDNYIRKCDLIDDFSKLDCDSFAKKSNKELIEWQASYPIDSPHYMFVLQELNNRSISKQLQWVKYSAILGPIATIIAGILSFMAGSGVLSDKKEKNSIPTQLQATTKVAIAPAVQNPVKKLSLTVHSSARNDCKTNIK